MFRSKMLGLVGSTIAALGISGTAFALPWIHHKSSAPWLHHDVSRNYDPPAPTSAPEMDPASALGALTFLAGGLAMIRGRRKKD